MESEAIKQKLARVLSIAPSLKEILLSTDSVESKRSRLYSVLTDQLAATFNDDPTIPPLEWILTRDAVYALRKILSRRSERLAGYSFLQYLDNLLHRPDSTDSEVPAPGFFAEVEHMLKGVMGKTGVYAGKTPAFAKHDGEEAAKLRSADLSRISRLADSFIDRYPSGLDHDAIEMRRANKSRILEVLDAGDSEWESWQWHTAHTIKDADTLASLVAVTDDEYRAVELANKHGVPFGITPHYLSLMDDDTTGGRDRAIRAQVIPSAYYVEELASQKECGASTLDFMLERNTSPIEGITRRYPKIVILKPFMTCPQICVYCQRNWEIEDVLSSHARLPDEKLDRAIEWIADHPDVNEVLITGGDPFLLSDKRIKSLLDRLSRIEKIERIRIGTRTPVTLPQRVTDALIRDIAQYHIPGKREIMVVTHFEHAYEVTPQSMEAVQKFRRTGMSVYNQLVYTFYNSRKFEAVALRHKLRLIGVSPYYTFNTKGKDETDDFRVPIARLLQEQKEEARLSPGAVRTDETVFNVPGLGKSYLRADQHHDVISILPNGRRVFEFHPWEKNLSLADTYIYTDVAIHDYLERLKDAGEDLAHYKTIWYYY